MNLLFTIDRAYLPYFKGLHPPIARAFPAGWIRIYVMHTGLAPEDFGAELEAEFGFMDCAFSAPIEVDPRRFVTSPRAAAIRR